MKKHTMSADGSMQCVKGVFSAGVYRKAMAVLTVFSGVCGISDLRSSGSAVHTGKITTRGGRITLINTGPHSGFTGSTRNGVTTRSVSQNGKPSYRFQ